MQQRGSVYHNTHKYYIQKCYTKRIEEKKFSGYGGTGTTIKVEKICKKNKLDVQKTGASSTETT